MRAASEDRRLLAESLARVVQGHAGAGLRRELGAGDWLWPAADEGLLPRAAHVVEVGLVLGRESAPLPWSHLVLAASLLERAAIPRAREHLQALARGEPAVAVLADARGPVPVVDAAAASLLVVVDDHGRRIRLLEQPAKLQPRPVRTLDGLEAAWIDAAQLPDSWASLRVPDAWHEALDWALLASCARIAGLLQRLVRQTVAFVDTRRQFGVVVGSFQAVQHRAVDLHIAAEELRALLHATEAAMDRAERAAAVARLRIKCARSARVVMQGAVQLHGAMGLTRELPVGAAVLAVEAELARHAGAAQCAARLLPPEPGTGLQGTIRC
ncbi:MAG TPA: acyl-CoA dehydrogenase family protein [Ramlibacter sp.]|nr:acyl-CoA dehydrogenase family protein [Ramlibacter sp.]